MSDNTISIFRARADRFTEVLDHVDGRWQAATPCEQWTVADVVRHVVDTENDFLSRHGLAGEAIASADPAEAWRRHRAHVESALTQDVADRRFDGYFGPTTIGDTMANFYGWDLAVHAWDIARAIGLANPISEADAEDLIRVADTWGDALYGEGICHPARAVAPDAPAAERLLGKLGRDPHWAPAA